MFYLQAHEAQHIGVVAALLNGYDAYRLIKKGPFKNLPQAWNQIIGYGNSLSAYRPERSSHDLKFRQTGERKYWWASAVLADEPIAYLLKQGW